MGDATLPLLSVSHSFFSMQPERVHFSAAFMQSSPCALRCISGEAHPGVIMHQTQTSGFLPLVFLHSNSSPTGFASNGELSGYSRVTPLSPKRKTEEIPMDWNRVEGNWKQVKGKIQEQWGKLTDDDLDQISGRREQLEGKIQERYGVAKDRAKSEIDDWYSRQQWLS
ncbi:uncharacterized protein YjbJ (UPF0337 family) [Ochrobactrum sp. RH2CCR150]|nr:uncharacterized protein YjbJ (UPF0337 family) [Ochrobactrum sp. RH2CCR150]